MIERRYETIAALLVGAAFGFLAGKFYYKDKYEELFQTELASVKQYFGHSVVKEEPSVEDITVRDIPKVNFTEYESKVVNYGSSTIPDSSSPISIFRSIPEDVGTLDDATWSFYAGDEVLVDEEDELVDNPTYHIGSALDLFKPKDLFEPNQMNSTIYVANSTTQTLYEIIKVDGCYQDIVLGEYCVCRPQAPE